jgi:hypothetical protein
MEKRSKDKAMEDSDEEAAILESAGGALQEQTSYESQVLKQAIQSNAPKLTGIGFPDLNSIVPTRNSGGSNKRVKISPSEQRLYDQEVTHVLTTLRNVKQSLDAIESSTNTESKEAQLLRMKYHILLTYLATNTSVKSHELGISMSRDIQMEERRKIDLIQRRHSSHMTEDESSAQNSKKNVSYRLERIKMGVDNLSNNISFGKQAIEARKATLDRVRERAASKKLTMMESKKDMAGEAWVDPKVLYEKRMARLERRKRRRGDKDLFVQEAVDKTKNTSGSTELMVDETGNNRVSKSSSSSASSKKTKVVHCGICDQNISVHPKHATDIDSFLSRHMQSCSGRRKPSFRTGTRNQVRVDYNENDSDINDDSKLNASSSKQFVNDEDIGDAESSDDELFDSVSLDEKDEFTERITFRRGQDDFDEHDYEDRVDDWLENGIVNMKNMSEKLDDDEAPGTVVLDGEYEIPAWINDRLFGYQRTGLKWLWELHQQECGGILGDGKFMVLHLLVHLYYIKLTLFRHLVRNGTGENHSNLFIFRFYGIK